ncbi:DNA methyltransferase [Rhodopseudomonas sp. AAP120]|uniref:class I SAM-dependent DNA methyltransferase n=1 Tax=Rhodopseudomonas sp. AAP120 TaxID=1523430 RepID=UPI0006B95D29|nr:DNA methyltransferase [Rhodopseudomonas sp. AAP120]KPF97336.1 DNA methyltransferase [Rhodopseudomonas sp. AAP120]
MTPAEFIKKWKPVALNERASAQTHFIDLCKLFEHDDPVSADPAGEWFAFEKGATKTGGGDGFADVWKKNYFAWEYKKKKHDLGVAMNQLVRYAAALENPPLQVVCDTDRFIIRTAWTNTVAKQYEIELDELTDPDKRKILWAVFHDPEQLKPQQTRAGITKDAADKFSTIALRLQGRGTPEEIAHFVNQLVFCFFASSVKLLPEGFFPKLLKRAAEKPERAIDYFNRLFQAMETGGEYDLTDIAHFNGGLFDGRRALKLDEGDIGLLTEASSLDWSQIDPTIFGTLFERFLDPDKRAQIGAHYTDPDKIMMIVEPVILRPLRAEWDAVRRKIEPLVKAAHLKKGRAFDNAMAKAEEPRAKFIERLRGITILDPACGSGNFLYLALQGVKDIELRANLECEALGLSPRLPVIGPEIVHGLEINELAAELARTTIWIGDIQWRIRNGIYSNPRPILRKLDSIECRDALISTQPDGGYVETEWPAAEFIVGNPPFLGGKLLRTGSRTRNGNGTPGLGDEAVERLFQIFVGRVSREADLVVYWFEKARTQIASGLTQRAGLVTTNSIRAGANREILDRIEPSTIFEAWSDEPWVIDGASVRVSIVCFGNHDGQKTLNGDTVQNINSDLTSDTNDLTKARRLVQNRGVAFVGRQKDGPIDIDGRLARDLITSPMNPNGRPNSDVVHPWMNASAIVRRSPDKWIIDFKETTESSAALYQAPFEYLKLNLKPIRETNRDPQRRQFWWRPGRSGEDLRRAVSTLQRFIATPRVAKHRLFVWLDKTVVPDSRLFAFAREDDTFFGVLHSIFHERWSLRTCSWHGVGNDPTYNAFSCFESFPFPEGLTPNIPAADYAGDSRAQAIAKAAKRLDELRNAWLNPSDLIRIEPEVVPGYPDRILPKDTKAAVELKKRTLTNLYNARPQWLQDAHRDLDAAVAAAYGWPADISEDDALAKLLELNLARAGAAMPAAVDEDDSEES